MEGDCVLWFEVLKIIGITLYSYNVFFQKTMAFLLHCTFMEKYTHSTTLGKHNKHPALYFDLNYNKLGD